MTADEIRSQWNVTGRFPPELLGDFALIEIAAQLAELNARFASVQMPDGVISVGLCSTNDDIRVRIAKL